MLSPTSPSKNFLQSKLARSLRGSLRISTDNSSRVLARAIHRTSATGRDNPPNEDEASSGFEHITHDDLPIQLDFSPRPLDRDAPPLETNPVESPTPTATPVSPNRSSPPSQPTQSTLSRLKNFSRISLDHFPHPHLLLRSSTFSRFSRLSIRSQKQQVVDVTDTDLILEFPNPPTHIPTPIASAHEHIVTQSAAADTDRISASPHPHPLSDPYIPDAEVEDPSIHPHHTSITSSHTSASAPDTLKSKSKVIPRSLRNLSSLAKTAIKASFRTPISHVSPAYSAKAKQRRRTRPTSEPFHPSEQFPRIVLSPLPELPLEISHLTPIPIPVGESSVDQRPVDHASQLITYEYVSPLDLTASPSPLLGGDLLSSARTSFAPPSPSWLSRNVQGLELHSEILSILDAETLSSYPSPPPLPIPPPRVFLSPPVPSDTPPLSPLEVTQGWLTTSTGSLRPHRPNSIITLTRSSSISTLSRDTSSRNSHSSRGHSGKERKYILHSSSKACYLRRHLSIYISNP